MKVIFLDIDGVLNGYNDFGGRRSPNPRIEGFWGISTAKVRKLERIINETGAIIVLDSSWKSAYEEYLQNGYINKIGKYLRNKLRNRGLEIYETTYKYSKSFHSQRGVEIKSWLKEHEKEIESWVVLDDEVFSDFDQEIINHLVLTSIETGLTDEDVNKAICILLNKPYTDTAFEKIWKVDKTTTKDDGPQYEI